MRVTPEPADGEAARQLFDDYMAELTTRSGGEFDRDGYPDPSTAEFTPPQGALLVGREDGRAIACGGVRLLSPGVAEIKRMYVVPEARGRGLGRVLLAALEGAARGLGCSLVRLDTAAPLHEAAALYASAGYRSIPAYNHNANAVAWFEKEL
ncbi:MAG TPA: GNAT family N-acetyltransferase [Gaiellales bacterium]|nr:GNAT family N-acetyltransferase [Gaiellales bacterium]